MSWRLDEVLELHQQGRIQAALALVDQHLAEQPDEAPLWLQKGRILEATGHDAEALAAYLNARNLDPSSLEAWTDHAFLAGRLDPARGIDVFVELLQHFPRNPTAWANLGTLHDRAGDPFAAEAAYRIALTHEARPGELDAVRRRLGLL